MCTKLCTKFGRLIRADRGLFRPPQVLLQSRRIACQARHCLIVQGVSHRRLCPFRCTGLPSLGWSGGVYGTYASAETRFQVPYPAIGRQHLRHHRHFPPPMRLRSGSLPQHVIVRVEQHHRGGRGLVDFTCLPTVGAYLSIPTFVSFQVYRQTATNIIQPNNPPAARGPQPSLSRPRKWPQ